MNEYRERTMKNEYQRAIYLNEEGKRNGVGSHETGYRIGRVAGIEDMLCAIGYRKEAEEWKREALEVVEAKVQAAVRS